ncbi:MAG: aldehyde dehydrogenase family protein [Patescibacteria group bacterium]
MSETTYVSLALTEKDHRHYEEALSTFEKELGADYRSITVGYGSVQNDARWIISRNPANTEQVVARFVEPNSLQVEQVIIDAKNLSSEIESMGWTKRLEILTLAAKLVNQKKYHIAAILTYEAGKTRIEALAEVNEVIAMINNYRELLYNQSYYTHIFTGEKSLEKSFSQMRALGGPTAVIVPFNFPFALAAGMSMAAFLAGNSVVFKPSEQCPLSTLQWRDIMIESGVPKKACGFLVGSGEVVGEQLVRDKDIAAVAFTGSLAVGKKIMAVHNELWQKNIFRLTPVMEMGGSNAVIVTKSADFQSAAEGILKSVLGYSGQKCSAARRLICVGKETAEAIHKLIYYLVKNGFPGGQQLVLGDPKYRETYLGPLISSEAVHIYHRLGDAFEINGKSPFGLSNDILDEEGFLDTETLGRGNFVLPIMVGGKPTKKMKEIEYFMPVLFAQSEVSLEATVQEANDTPYGLTAGLFSQDEKEIEYFLNRIEAGSVYINRSSGATTGCWPGVQTFGGWKGSGSTGKNAFGKWYILNFLREQNVTRVFPV